MVNTKQLSLRIDKETHSMLVALCKKSVRKPSEMMRFLIRQEFERGAYALEEQPGNGKPDVAQGPCE